MRGERVTSSQAREGRATWTSPCQPVEPSATVPGTVTAAAGSAGSAGSAASTTLAPAPSSSVDQLQPSRSSSVRPSSPVSSRSATALISTMRSASPSRWSRSMPTRAPLKPWRNNASLRWSSPIVSCR